MNDWVIQKYVQDEDTGGMQLGERSSFQSVTFDRMHDLLQTRGVILLGTRRGK